MRHVDAVPLRFERHMLLAVRKSVMAVLKAAGW